MGVRGWWLVGSAMLGTVSAAGAFEVASWRSGMQLAQIVEHAGRYRLPLHPVDGAWAEEAAVGERVFEFDYDTVVEDWGAHKAFRYEAQVWGRPGSVTLRVTPGTLVLFELVFSWPVADPGAFAAYLRSELDREYGGARECGREFERAQRVCWYSADGVDRVTLSWSYAQVFLEYRDRAWGRLAPPEVQAVDGKSLPGSPAGSVQR